LKAGILTEEEFAEKKAELLNNGNEKQQQIRSARQPAIQQQVTPIRTEEEQAYIDAEYDRLFNNKSWFEKYRNLIISILIIAILGTIIWYLFTSESNSLNNNSIQSTAATTTGGLYRVNADDINLVHFYRQADIATQKPSYFNSRAVVYVQKVENGFGYVEYTKNKGQTSKGWLRMQDLQYCSDCEK
jgi:hypothetical protein